MHTDSNLTDRPRFETDPFKRCRRLARIKEFVGSNIHRPIQQREIASVVGLSPSQFSRMFHKKTGMRYRDWLRQRRITHAMNLLSKFDDPIGTIAFEVGFGSISTFGRAFKKVTGMTPREYSNGRSRQNIL